MKLQTALKKMKLVDITTDKQKANGTLVFSDPGVEVEEKGNPIYVLSAAGKVRKGYIKDGKQVTSPVKIADDDTPLDALTFAVGKAREEFGYTPPAVVEIPEQDPEDFKFNKIRAAEWEAQVGPFYCHLAWPRLYDPSHPTGWYLKVTNGGEVLIDTYTTPPEGYKKTFVKKRDAEAYLAEWLKNQ